MLLTPRKPKDRSTEPRRWMDTVFPDSKYPNKGEESKTKECAIDFVFAELRDEPQGLHTPEGTHVAETHSTEGKNWMEKAPHIA